MDAIGTVTDVVAGGFSKTFDVFGGTVETAVAIIIFMERFPVGEHFVSFFRVGFVVVANDGAARPCW